METLNPDIAIGDRVMIVGLGTAQNDVGQVVTVDEISDLWYCYSSGKEEPAKVPYRVKFDNETFHWFIHNRLKAL